MMAGIKKIFRFSGYNTYFLRFVFRANGLNVTWGGGKMQYKCEKQEKKILFFTVSRWI